ncbi:hypothetical protein QOZ80_1AG0007950 [Eleusine coracana subsp. coracana]|nr:hypothetical protein QOZ80_1AG0007950 [Eleusine coracana subsp. coracana]
MERDGDTNKRKGEEAQQEEYSAKRLKGTIGSDAFSCDACTQPLKPPIFQCSTMGHFFLCSSCHDKQPMCQVCAGWSRPERSYGMERAIQSFLVDCWYANHGCQEKTTYYEKERHKKACPHVPCSCPYSSGCGFAGQAAELWDHLTAHHKCPRLEFEYGLEFDLRVEPAIHVLRGIDDGQLILVHIQTGGAAAWACRFYPLRFALR